MSRSEASCSRTLNCVKTEPETDDVVDNQILMRDQVAADPIEQMDIAPVAPALAHPFNGESMFLHLVSMGIDPVIAKKTAEQLARDFDHAVAEGVAKEMAKQDEDLPIFVRHIKVEPRELSATPPVAPIVGVDQPIEMPEAALAILMAHDPINKPVIQPQNEVRLGQWILANDMEIGMEVEIDAEVQMDPIEEMLGGNVEVANGAEPEVKKAIARRAPRSKLAKKPALPQLSGQELIEAQQIRQSITMRRLSGRGFYEKKERYGCLQCLYDFDLPECLGQQVVKEVPTPFLLWVSAKKPSLSEKTALWKIQKAAGRDVAIWAERARRLQREQDRQVEMGVIRVKARKSKGAKKTVDNTCSREFWAFSRE